MPQTHKHKPDGESTGDDAAPPLRGNTASAAEQVGGMARANHWIRPLLLLSAISLIAMAAFQWADVVDWVDGEWRLKPKRAVERDRQMKNVDDAEQYVLLAIAPGYYDCLHCPSKRIYLHTNEVWKYGVTNQGKKLRYSAQFLKQKQLDYKMQFRGTYSQCLIEEKRKLFDYPLLPEN